MSWNGWAACKYVWCGDSYVPPENIKFHWHKVQDEDGYYWGRGSDAERHTKGRDGDHLVTPCVCLQPAGLKPWPPGPADDGVCTTDQLGCLVGM